MICVVLLTLLSFCLSNTQNLDDISIGSKKVKYVSVVDSSQNKFTLTGRLENGVYINIRYRDPNNVAKLLLENRILTSLSGMGK
jgi:hypothetical protein